ncbi:MAG: MFS transporter [Candidatus Micrarchaeia archaeon]
MRKLLAINFLQYFIGSALAIALPLLLLERGIDVATIGAIFAALPVVFLAARTVFAAIADQAGIRRFFLLNAAANAGMLVVYYLADSPPLYALGKVMEGVKDSSFWAVVRTAAFSDARGMEARSAALLSGVRTLATALGTLGAGAAIALWSFEGTLLALLVLSLLLFPPSLLLKKDTGRWSLGEAARLVFRKRSAFFWKASLAVSLYGLAANALFVLPIFMKSELGLGYKEIGALFALYYLLGSAVTLLSVRARLPFGWACAGAFLLFSPAAVLLWNPGLFLPLFALLALGDGLAAVVFENVIARASVGNSSVSTDIAVMHAPFRVMEFVAFIGAGWVAQHYGFAPVFAGAALAFALFCTVALKIR